MKNRVITISREFGSGGRTIGKEVADRLGIPCYDHELIDRLAEESGLSKEYITNESEYASHSSWTAAAFSSVRSFGVPSNQDYLWAIQRRIILELGQKENCVIVGRCADYVLRHRNPLRLFFYADIADRMERCRKRNEEQKSLNRAVLRKIITQTDKNRSRYYEFLSGQKWGAKENYDLCFNTSSADTEKIIQCVISLL